MSQLSAFVPVRVAFSVFAFLFLAGAARSAPLYVSVDGDNSVVKIENGSASTFAAGLNYPSGLAFDGAGRLYVANYSAGNILRVDSYGYASTFATLAIPYGLAFAGNGDLYVSH